MVRSGDAVSAIRLHPNDDVAIVMRPLDAGLRVLDTRQRRVVARRLSATAMQSMEPEFRELIDGALEGALRSGRIEWMREVAEPLPMIMVARILGVWTAMRRD